MYNSVYSSVQQKQSAVPGLNFTIHLFAVLNCGVERDVWRKLETCDFTGPPLVKQKKEKKTRTNVLASDMPDAVSARLATVDNILVITARVGVGHLG